MSDTELFEDKTLSRTTTFLASAFCIDGECKFSMFINDGVQDGAEFVLTDSKRGTFYVSLYKKNNPTA